MNKMDEKQQPIYALLGDWQVAYDDLEKVGAPIKAKINDLLSDLSALQRPLEERLAIIEAEICPLAIARAGTIKTPGVNVSYRKGATRVTYDWRTVDSVKSILQDVLPKTALTLEGARSQSTGKPSVSIVRVEEQT